VARITFFAGIAEHRVVKVSVNETPGMIGTAYGARR